MVMCGFNLTLSYDAQSKSQHFIQEVWNFLDRKQSLLMFEPKHVKCIKCACFHLYLSYDTSVFISW